MDEGTWRARQAAHRARVEPWVTPRLDRRRRGDTHATDDFLFEYYPFSPTKLLTWHPGAGVVLEGDAGEFLANAAYRRTPTGVTVDPARLASRRQRLVIAIRVLEGTRRREPGLGCFALHEWAMVYGLQQHEIRHNTLPLRIPPDEIRATVDQIGLRCTHIDAFRFFTPDATPMNALEPTRATQPDLEQPGCLHANMDLYKYGMWFSPYVGSELIADAFEVARAARALDMQASPYDSTVLGLEPVPVETADGRREYVTRQRDIMTSAEPVRDRLLAALGQLQSMLDEPVSL